MRAPQVHLIFILLAFALSLFLLIAAVKYADWARVMIAHEEGTWLSLVFYAGSVPMISLFYNTVHLIVLHFDIVPLDPEHEPDERTYPASQAILIGSAIQLFMWLGQATVWTACELAPIASGAQGRVPGWCPQSKFRDTGNAGLANMLSTVAISKDLASWTMVFLSVGLVECSRRTWGKAKMLDNRQMFFRSENDWKNGMAIDGVEMKGLGKRGGFVPLAELPGSLTKDYESRV